MEKIISRSNPVCVHIRKLGKSKSYRDECGEFLCDGFKLLDEAIKSSAEIKSVLFSGEFDCELPQNVRKYHVKEDLLDSLSPLKNSQEVLFVCRMRKSEHCDFSTGTHILLDGIQDPGNVGTILRSAHAFGIKSVILTENSADVFNPKTIRASMGAVFKQLAINMSNKDILALHESGISFSGTSNDVNSIDIRNTELHDSIIILGNEGQGISKDFIKLCNQMIKIPVSSECESINVAVAASIIMWEAGK